MPDRELLYLERQIVEFVIVLLTTSTLLARSLAITARCQVHEFTGHDFNALAFLTIIACEPVDLQPAFNVDLAAFAVILVGNFSELPEADDPIPVWWLFFTTLTLLASRSTVDSDRECGHCSPVLGKPHLRLLANVSNNMCSCPAC
jgi:hypothetical protein